MRTIKTSRTKSARSTRKPLPENGFEIALEQVRAMRRGETTFREHVRFVPPPIDVAAVRASLNLSQAAFASRFGFSLGAIRNWEQGIRQPDAAARTLLHLISRHPEDLSKMIDEVAAT